MQKQGTTKQAFECVSRNRGGRGFLGGIGTLIQVDLLPNGYGYGGG